MKKTYFWCVTLLHSDGTESIHYFEANSLCSFPRIEGRIVDVYFKSFSK